ncbi:MAG: PAS domain S-box protein [Candidatus Promineifilaceae bacterium]
MSDNFQILRKRAEQIIKDAEPRQFDFAPQIDIASLSLEEAQRIIEKFQVYQVELELQNEELRQTQEALEKAHARYRQLYHATPVGYLTLDSNGLVTSINDTCLKMLATERKAIVYRPFSFFVATINLDEYFEYLQDLVKRTTTNQPLYRKLILQCGNSQSLHAELTGTIENIGRENERLFRIVILDVSDRIELLQTQRLLQAAIEHSRDVISISDMQQLDNPVVYVSPSVYEVTGYEVNDLLGKNWRLLYQDNPDRRARAILREGMLSGTEVQTRVRNIRKDGSPFKAEVVLYPLRDAHGRISHFVNVLRDVTEKERAEEALRQMQRLDSVGTLAGGIAHDFNNLLAAISAQAAMVKRKVGPKHPSFTHVSRISDAVDSGIALTRQLLSYAGRGSFKVELIEFNKLVCNTVKLVGSSAPHDIEVKWDLNESVLLLRADSGQIQQVIMNLVVNAWDAIEGAGQVTISTSREVVLQRDDLGEYVLNEAVPGFSYACLTVTDTGCGMDEATQQRVFDPFFSTKEQGYGLGLSAVAGVIRSHRGALRVQSEVGVGSSFKALFPLAVHDVKPAGNDLKRDNEAAQLHDHLQARISEHPDYANTVLVIDDEDSVRQGYVDLLTDLGYRTLTASNGKIGLEKFYASQNEIGLIIIDMYMPVMNGERTFRKLRELDRAVPCLLVSGYSKQETRERLADLGNVHFLQKPYNIEQFIDLVEAMITERVVVPHY